MSGHAPDGNPDREGVAISTTGVSELPVDAFEWVPLGRVTLDASGDLLFPAARAVPGIYRFTITSGSGVVAEYVGQAASSIHKRFRSYRSRGRSPRLPLERMTTSRNARFMVDALAAGRSITVALLKESATSPDGRIVRVDLTAKAVRDGLERRLIAWLCTTGVVVLNRHRSAS